MLFLFSTLGGALRHERIPSLAHEDRKYPRHSDLREVNPGPWSLSTREADIHCDAFDIARHWAFLAIGKAGLW